MSFWSTIKETPGLRKPSIVFTEGINFTVNVPATQVYDIITDFANYKAWNTWSPEFKLGKQEVTVGSRGVLFAKALLRDYQLPVEVLPTIQLPVLAVLNEFMQIIKLENNENSKTLAFRGLLLPSWFAAVERVHTVVPTGEGCTVTSWESMSGWGAYLLKYLLKAREQVQDANIKFARDLAAFAEAMGR